MKIYRKSNHTEPKTMKILFLGISLLLFSPEITGFTFKNSVNKIMFVDETIDVQTGPQSGANDLEVIFQRTGT